MLTIQEWFLSAIAIAGGAGGVFFLLFQFVGKTWLENKFTQRLDYLRHQHDIEVARLRVEIDSMLNGTLKLQEKEFEILPKFWELLDNCFLKTLFATASSLSYADIDRMNEQQVEELLDKTQFPASQKARIREANPKSDLYISYLTFERVQDAMESSIELGNYLSLNGILIPVELKDKLVSITTSLAEINHRVRAIFIHKVPGSIYDFNVVVEGLRPLLKEIENNIQKRLASHSKPFAD